MKKCLMMVMVFGFSICNAQNLVPNGDFEVHSACPSDVAQLNLALPWLTPTIGTSDYFNQCATNPNVRVPYNTAGYQMAHSGDGYAGIILFYQYIGQGYNYREYLQVQLTSVLINNTSYHFEMYVSLAEINYFSVSDIGIYFSDTLISNPSDSPLPFTPQINNTTGQLVDSINWILVSGNYVAHGGEQYLIIGNFKNDSLTDTLIVNPIFPAARFAYYFVDDITLSVETGIGEQIKNSSATIYPNPFTTQLNIKLASNERAQLILYDIASRKLLQQAFTNSVSINTTPLESGIYFYEVRNKNGAVQKGKVVKQ
jgi:hypothetical protein